MEPIVQPLEVNFERSSPTPVTYPTGTLVQIKGTSATCFAIGNAKLIAGDGTGSAQHIGKYVHPPNCRDRQRAAKDVILFTPDQSKGMKLAILADPLTLGSEYDSNQGSDYYNRVFISAAVGGVVELDWGPHLNRGLEYDNGTLTAASNDAVAGADVYISV